MKKKCKKIVGLLEDNEKDDLFSVQQQQIKEHLSNCTECREELILLESINDSSIRLEDECQMEMESIDWDATSKIIYNSIPFETSSVKDSLKSPTKMLPSFNLNWKFAFSAMTGIFLLGLWLGYFLFHDSTITSSNHVSSPTISQQSSLARLENTLARKEVENYFGQTELIFMDLMKQCNSDGNFSMKEQVDIRRVQELLSRSRYFKDNLDNPKLLSSKKLMKKIEWLLYEILMTDKDEDSSCRKLEKLQNFIKEERLLMKMRLVGKDLSLSEV